MDTEEQPMKNDTKEPVGNAKESETGEDNPQEWLTKTRKKEEEFS